MGAGGLRAAPLFFGPIGLLRTNRRVGALAYDGSPGADAPSAHEAVADVGIGLGEPLDGILVLCFEEQDGLVHRIAERTRQEKFAPFGSLPGEGEVFSAELGPSFEVVLSEVVDQQEVHGTSMARGA
ncbi:MAG: hypothetical protein KatS3mg015_0315 [Fimbriimonadales bacterium]|nr:MAG: hypothetical protein KatS3mg015_0315 [Fimbriimonadales bacterium]